MKITCYSDGREPIWLRFWPCRCDENISWEEWYQCKDPLTVYAADYEKLLLPFFKAAFPLPDPTNREIQEYFDVCGVNWIGREAWKEILKNIRGAEARTGEELAFYEAFVRWVSGELEEWEVIEVEGNL